MGAGAAENRSSQPPAAEEGGGGADQPEAGRGGIGGGLNAGACQGSEAEAFVSAQLEVELDGIPQPGPDVVEEEVMEVSPH